MKWVNGRETKIVSTTRPDSVWPEVWYNMTQKARKKEIEDWAIESSKRAISRTNRGIPELITDEEHEEYKEALRIAKRKYSIPPAPAMPVKARGLFASACQGREQGGADDDGELERSQKEREHQDHNASVGFASSDYFGLVYTQVPMGEAMRIPQTKQAIDHEWNMRGNIQKVWDVTTVCEKSDVIKRCKAMNRSCHFGTLMDL